MSLHCYVCDYNFSSSDSTYSCPGCGNEIKVSHCSCWPWKKPSPGSVFKIWNQKLEQWHRNKWRSEWTKRRYAEEEIERSPRLDANWVIVEFELIEKNRRYIDPLNPVLGRCDDEEKFSKLIKDLKLIYLKYSQKPLTSSTGKALIQKFSILSTAVFDNPPPMIHLEDSPNGITVYVGDITLKAWLESLG